MFVFCVNLTNPFFFTARLVFFNVYFFLIKLKDLSTGCFERLLGKSIEIIKRRIFSYKNIDDSVYLELLQRRN